MLPAAAAWLGPRLAFACFTGFYLVSPVITVGGSPPIAFDPDNTIIRVGGVAAVIAAAACLALAWSRETPTDGKPNRVLAFLFVFLAGALLPVSSMTEGKRYLYLASVGMALLAALVVNRLRGRSRIAALAVAAALVAVSGWQIQLKAGDWTWAGTMTRDAVRTIRTLTPDPCRGRNVMFLTAPVNIRDVYCNFYDYTFEDPSTGCVPETVRAVVRVVGNDVQTTARWADPKTLVFATRGQADRLLTSTDLRSFDMPLAQGAAGRLRLPIGSLAVRSDTSGRDFELNLAAEVDPRQWHFLYYGSGAVHRVPAAPPNGGR
jgi:hypothetical protein